MRKVWALWYGGANYSAPYLDTHLEEFNSLGHARREFESRRYGIGIQDTFYVSLPNSPVAFPAVDESSELLIYFRNPLGEHDPYPDARLYWGPRGGIRQESC